MCKYILYVSFKLDLWDTQYTKFVNNAMNCTNIYKLPISVAEYGQVHVLQFTFHGTEQQFGGDICECMSLCNLYMWVLYINIHIFHCNFMGFSHPDEGLWDILIKDIPKEVTSYTFSMDILKQGVSYDFRVIAVNDYGYGTPSTPSPSVSGKRVECVILSLGDVRPVHLPFNF